jgi:hypothetical protein
MGRAGQAAGLGGRAVAASSLHRRVKLRTYLDKL